MIRSRGTLPGWLAFALLVAIPLTCFFPARATIASPAPVFAPHPAVSTVAVIKLSPPGHVELRLLHDTLAFALKDTSVQVTDAQMYELLRGPPEALAAALDDARQRLASQIEITPITAGVPSPPLPLTIVESATPDSIARWRIEHPDQKLPVRIDAVLSTTLPPGTSAVTFRFPPTLADVVILVDRTDLEPVNMPLQPGETSPTIDVSMLTRPASPAPAAPSAVPPATSSTKLPTPGATTPITSNPSASTTASSTPASAATPAAPADQIGIVGVSLRYLSLGFRHIIPEGTDHCLFVLGLFLLSPRVKPVLWQITAFTAAHTLTLMLTALHLVSVPARLVEPAIAFSIAFVGVENLLTSRVHSWRYAVAFIFGLIHGMGVATSFTEAGFPAGQLVTSLAAFTVGVEAGHLSILAAAFALLAWTRQKPWYRSRVAIPLSLLIGLIALFWLVQRLGWLGN